MPHPRDDEPFDTANLEMDESFDGDDDEPFEREDFATRKARRLEDMKQERRDSLLVGVFGLPMLGLGAALCWLTVVALRRGWMEIDDADIVYAAQEPGWFYGFLVFGAAFGLFTAQLGARMLRHTVREIRRTARHARRIERTGTGRP